MLSTIHGPTGALIATKIKSPFISIPLIIASHFAQDYIPHWDVGQGLTKKKKSKKAAFFQELLIDFPFSIIITYFWPLKHYASFHAKFHHSTPKVIKGLIPQVIILIVIYLLK